MNTNTSILYTRVFPPARELPNILWKLILDYAVCAPQVLPSKEDGFIESLKATTDDCERSAQYVTSEAIRGRLRRVCRHWRKLTDSLDTWIVLEESNDPPSASRVQYPGGCECSQSGCRMNIPPFLARYDLKAQSRPVKALIENSTRANRNIMRIVREHASLSVLATSVDLRYPESTFSLSRFSTRSKNLTHLSLSEFNMPASPRPQILDLPQLHTLTLSFYCPTDSLPPGPTWTINHPSFHEWKLPSLRNLSLRGGVWDTDPAFLENISALIHRVGITLEGLLYNTWVFSPSRVDTPHPLPDAIWMWCPRLQSIQTSLTVLFSGPKPPTKHPRLTVVPVHIANLDTLPQIGHLLWPPELFQEFPWPTEWPIKLFKISTSWSTFYNKLRRLHVAGTYRRSSGTMNEDPDYWPVYFAKLGDLFRQRGFVVEDRYGGRLADGACPELTAWLNEFRLRYQSSPGNDV